MKKEKDTYATCMLCGAPHPVRFMCHMNVTLSFSDINGQHLLLDIEMQQCVVSNIVHH